MCVLFSTIFLYYLFFLSTYYVRCVRRALSVRRSTVTTIRWPLAIDFCVPSVDSLPRSFYVSYRTGVPPCIIRYDSSPLIEFSVSVSFFKFSLSFSLHDPITRFAYFAQILPVKTRPTRCNAAFIYRGGHISSNVAA